MEHSDNWQIEVLASDQDLVDELIGTLNFATTISTAVQWPHGLLTRPHSFLSTRNKTLKSQDFVIITGIPNEHELKAITASFYSLWGTAPEATIFVLKLPPEAQVKEFSSQRTAFTKFGQFYNARVSKAYRTAGIGKFKPGTSDHDFRPDMLLNALIAQPHETSGSTMLRQQLLTARFQEMMDEPETTAVPAEHYDHCFGGIETEEENPVSSSDIEIDKAAWKESGFKWIEGFMPHAQNRVLRFLEQQEAAGNKVAQASAKTSLFQLPGFIPKTPRIRKVEEFVLTKQDYRPCCRNTIHTWNYDGSMQEIGTKFHDIKHLLKFEVKNFYTAARILDLKDKCILQDLLSSGMSHHTSDFPLNTLCSRNLKSSSIYAAPLNKQWKTSIERGELAGANPDAEGDMIFELSKHPLSIPFLIIPMGAAVQHYKEEQYYLHKEGQPSKINCRGVFDGSSPHPQEGEKDISPNAHVTIPERLVLPWTSRKKFSWNLAVLAGCSTDISLFHLDYEGAYRQCVSRVTERWRQTVFWKCSIHGVIRGGYGEDTKMQWGGTSAANNYFRAVTNTTVKWIILILETFWKPSIKDPEVKQWIAHRELAGFTDQQTLPAVVDGFLDDMIIALSGSQEDKELGQIWVLTAIRFLGMKLSEVKFKEDGMLNERCNFLGDNYDLISWTRGIPFHKQDRLMDVLPSLLQQVQWHRKTLESLLGLLESVKGNVPRQWNLLPLYRILHSKDAEFPINEPPEFVLPSRKGKVIIERIMNTLHERQSLFWQPTQWPNPNETLLDGVAENDACIVHGFGGTIRIGNILYYMAEKWSHVPGFETIDIFSLECFTILLMVLTLGDMIKGRKIIFRSDSSNTCSTLNKLFSKNPVMMELANIWDDMQFHLDFEGLLCWIPGIDNIFSDQASRLPQAEYLVRFRQLLDERGLHNVELQELPTIWGDGRFDLRQDYTSMALLSQKHRIAVDQAKADSLRI